MRYQAGTENSFKYTEYLSTPSSDWRLILPALQSGMEKNSPNMPHSPVHHYDLALRDLGGGGKRERKKKNGLRLTSALRAQGPRQLAALLLQDKCY